MKYIAAKLVPRLLLPQQKEHSAAVANDLIQTTTSETDLLNEVITLRGTKASLSYVWYLASS